MKYIHNKKILYLICGIIAVMTLGYIIFSNGFVSNTNSDSKPATKFTKKKHEEFLNYLPFEDRTDFENAKKGFIATLDDPSIKENGKEIYNLAAFDFLLDQEGKESDTINPSLLRQGALTSLHGLFKVTDNIYQIRGFDLSNMTVIRGKTGWIVVDPLTSVGCAKAGMELIKKHLEDLPVSAIIFTHSHADHFGGLRGVINDKQLQSIEIIAPEKFFEESVNENLMAGNTMSRRASYMYGMTLEKNERGAVGFGLGSGLSAGEVTITKPTIEITKTPTFLTVDGIKMTFMNVPGAEAPAELMFYIPSEKAMCQAEEIAHTLHNLLTLRGAQVRNGLKWSKYIHDTIERFGDTTEVSFGSHHWPVWGNKDIVEFWKSQRDAYRYIHDEALRLANHGFTIHEIGNMVKLPDGIAKNFANRGYYGSVSHNSKAQYQMYFGYFTGNPSDLDPLVPVEEAQKFVDYAGGMNKLIKKAKSDYAKGEYRWVATALKHAVFVDPDNKEAKNILADAYEQLGYQAECGTWRNFYLTGAKELRYGVNKDLSVVNTVSPDMIHNLGLEQWLDYLAVRLDHSKISEEDIVINVTLTNAKEKFVIYIQNGVMNYTIGKHSPKSDVKVYMTRANIDSLNMGEYTIQDLFADKKVKVQGDKQKFKKFVEALDNFEFWFNIVTP